MRVLVACEFSGEVRDAFKIFGHDAWSCDLKPSERPGNHYQGDVFDIIDDGWDLMVAHPECTHLCVSGQRWFHSGHKSTRLRDDAIIFVKRLMDAAIPRKAIENPVSVISSRIRKPDQLIRPCQYGEDSTKATCLWLENLPRLVPVKHVTPAIHISKSGRKWDNWFFKSSLIRDKTERSRFRSRTFPGIAMAMAVQWGNEERLRQFDKVRNLMKQEDLFSEAR